MKRTLIIIVCAALLGVALYAACEEGDRRYADPVLDGLLNSKDYDVVDFNIAGNVKCSRCVERDIEPMGMKIEVVPKDDPMDELAIEVYDHIGPFNIAGFRYLAGVDLTIYVRIITDMDSPGYSKEVYATVPDEDGETIAITVDIE